MLSLRLYVSGMAPTTGREIDKLRALLDEAYPGAYELEVLDVIDHANEAYDDAVLATPTLVKHLPPPAAQIIGDLTNRERVLVGLRLERRD